MQGSFFGMLNRSSLQRMACPELYAILQQPTRLVRMQHRFPNSTATATHCPWGRRSLQPSWTLFNPSAVQALTAPVLRRRQPDLRTSVSSSSIRCLVWLKFAVCETARVQRTLLSHSTLRHRLRTAGEETDAKQHSLPIQR